MYTATGLANSLGIFSGARIHPDYIARSDEGRHGYPQPRFQGGRLSAPLSSVPLEIRRGLFHFLDEESFDQYELDTSQLGKALDYLKEQMVVEAVFYKGKVININLPTHVDLEVKETPPNFQGNTAQGGTKPTSTTICSCR